MKCLSIKCRTDPSLYYGISAIITAIHTLLFNCIGVIVVAVIVVIDSTLLMIYTYNKDIKPANDTSMFLTLLLKINVGGGRIIIVLLPILYNNMFRGYLHFSEN